MVRQYIINQEWLYYTIQVIVGSIGAIISQIDPMLPMLEVFTFGVIIDVISAFRLSKRVKRLYPNSNSGKLQSRKLKKIFSLLLTVYVLVVFAHFIQEYVITQSVFLPNIVSGYFCFIQFWSVLENESSCNDSGWAKILQKFLVNKVSRHLDYDFSDDLEELAKKREEQINQELDKHYEDNSKKNIPG